MKILSVMRSSWFSFFAILFIAGCAKSEESTGGAIPKSNVEFKGDFLLNGVDRLGDFKPFILLKGDTMVDLNFTKYGQSEYGLSREFDILDMKFGDTIALQPPRPYSFDIGYAVIDYDHITCTWRNTAEGYFYAERLNDISFKVDTWGVLVKEVCSSDQGEPDTIRVSLKGVFALI